MPIDELAVVGEKCIWKDVIEGKIIDEKMERAYAMMISDTNFDCKNCNGYDDIRCDRYQPDRRTKKYQ